MDPQNEVIKKEQGHDVSIALIQRDMEYVRKSIDKIDATLAVFDRNFARKDELIAVEKKIDEGFKALNDKLAEKVDSKEFDPMKKTLQKINWLMIAGVVVALLSLVIQAGK